MSGTYLCDDCGSVHYDNDFSASAEPEDEAVELPTVETNEPSDREQELCRQMQHHLQQSRYHLQQSKYHKEQIKRLASTAPLCSRGSVPQCPDGQEYVDGQCVPPLTNRSRTVKR